MDDFEAAEEQKSKLSNEQKAGFVLLVIFAVLAVGLGAVKIRNTIYGPMSLNNEIPPDLNTAVNDPSALKYRDTDLDGLSDFDELYVYSTSPYIADTDSDGIPDRTELEQSKDPLCGEGKTCNTPVMNAGAMAIATNTFTEPTAPVSLQNASVAQYGSGGQADVERLLTDPDYIRALLRQGGVSEEMLSKLTDEQLLAGVQEQFGQSMQNFNTSTSATQ